jgi:hypothetical protein
MTVGALNESCRRVREKDETVKRKDNRVVRSPTRQKLNRSQTRTMRGR